MGGRAAILLVQFTAVLCVHLLKQQPLDATLGESFLELGGSGTTVTMGKFTVNDDCLQPRCRFRRHSWNAWNNNVVCSGTCELRRKHENQMWYDWYSKQIRVIMSDGETRCLRISTDKRQLLVARDCSDSNNDNAKFEYDSAEKKFKNGGKCLSLSKSNTYKDHGDKSKTDGMTLAECADDDNRQVIEIPPGTYLGKLTPNVSEWENKRPCKESLGIESGLHVLRYSSFLNKTTNATNTTNATIDNGRLWTNGSWCANSTDTFQWLEIQMDGLMEVTALQVQGSQDVSKYVKRLKISYKEDPRFPLREFQAPQDFDVDNQGLKNKVIQVPLVPSFHAKVVRLSPTVWVGGICMRVNLIGCFSLKGDSGAIGNRGAKGYKGPPGQEGIIGNRGNDGAKGDKGFKGLRGSPGKKGRTGDRGPKGTKGPPGNTGSEGQPGPPGYRGEPGLPGDTGLPGPKGPQGQSPPGIPGRPGHKGALGLTGLQGPAGPPGKPGAKGLPGAPGAQGIRGQNGAPGELGPMGEKGPPGPSGQNGKDGKTGHPGSKGERGVRGPVTHLDEVIDRHVNNLGRGVELLSDKLDWLAITVAGGLNQTIAELLRWPPLICAIGNCTR